MFRMGSGRRFAIALAIVAATSFAASAQETAATPQPAKSTASTTTYAEVANALKLKVEIPTIEAVGSNVDTKTLKAIFTGNIAAHAGEIRHLNAQRITVPLVTISYVVPVGKAQKPMPVTIHYNDIVISEVTNGIAANVTIARVDSRQRDLEFAYNGMSASAVNFGAGLAFYGLGANDSAMGWQTLYRDFQVQGGTLDAPHAECTFGRIDLSRLEARPLKTSMLEIVSMLGDLDPEEKAEPDPKTLAELFVFLGDLTRAIKTGPITFDGLKCSFDDDDTTAKLSLGGLAIGPYLADTAYPEIDADGLRIAAEDGQFSIGKIRLKSIDYAGPLAALERAAGKLDDDWFEAHARELIPAFHGLSVQGVQFDVPDPEQSAERIKGGLKDFDLSLDGYRNAIPTDISSRLDSLVLNVPENSTDPSVRELRAMGLTKLDLSYDLRAFWNEAAQTINFDTIKIDAADLGTVGLRLLLGNAVPELFDSNPSLALMAGSALTFKSVHLNVVDNGFGKLIYTRTAADEDLEPKAVRTMLSGMAQGMVLAFLNGNPAASELATAIGNLIDKSTPLAATVSANDPNGIGIDELQTLEKDPTALNDKITITLDKAP